MNANNLPQVPALRGRYSLEVINLDGSRLTHEFSNLITQQGREQFAAKPLRELLSTAGLGISNTPASDEQIRLVAPVGSNQVAGLTLVTSDSDSDTVSVQFVFPEGTFDNVDLSEVGVFDNTGKLFSRALFKNALGNAEPINVQKTQRVVLTYLLDIVKPQAPQEVQLLMADAGNILRTYTVRAYPQNVPRYKMVSNALQEFGPSPASLNTCSVTLITDPAYAGVPGTAAAAEKENIPTGNLVLDPYEPGSRKRKFAVRIDSQYGNKASGITGLEIVHPFLGVVLTVTMEPAMVKTSDYRLFIDLALDW